MLAGAGGLPSDEVRAVATDGDGSIWYATAAGAAVRRPDGAVTPLTHASTAGGLAHDDVRAVALGTDGTVWFAHAGGVSRRLSDGTWGTTLTHADGLASDDCRHVLVEPDGASWMSCAAGLSRRDADGRWRTWTAGAGELPSDDVRHSAPAAGGGVCAATANGIALVNERGTRAISLVAAGAAPGCDDVRWIAAAPADPESPATSTETVWAATAGGVVELRSPQLALGAGIADGLPSADCRAVLVAADGTIWAATAAGAAWRSPDRVWRRVTTADGLPSDDVRGLHGPWSAPLEFAPAGGGERDPFVTVDATGRVWLAYSELRGIGDAGDTWLLRARRLESASAAWSPPIELTTIDAGDRVTDRHPHLVTLPGGGARTYFDSDRRGGAQLWSVDLSGGDVAGQPVQITAGGAFDTHPTIVASAPPVLLFRSDRSVPLARLGVGIPGVVSPTMSRRTPDEASVRRFAGTVTASPGHLERNREHRQFDDLLSYTPQKPRGPSAAPAAASDELYTRGTIGLYVERGPIGRPLSAADADRLRQLLRSFLPANLRAVIVLQASTAQLEDVFDRAHPLQDAFADDFPFVETVGLVGEATAVALPDWQLLRATDRAGLTVDPRQPTTLRRRTWHPDPR